MDAASNDSIYTYEDNIELLVQLHSLPESIDVQATFLGDLDLLAILLEYLSDQFLFN